MILKDLHAYPSTAVDLVDDRDELELDGELGGVFRGPVRDQP